jgi:DNA topoisomerase-1
MAAVLSAGWTGDLPPEDFPTPNDVAMVGWTPELATRIWPGKDLLSNRSIAWDGVLRLQPPETTGSDRGIDLLRASPIDGMRLATAEDRQRLAIPPAYTDVYVSTDPNAKMVWRGVDSQGRMQRGYSAEHHENQAALKFERMKALTERIDTLDAALVRDADTDDRAASLALIRHFGMRPGSRKDTQARKQAFGATTLQARHVRQYPDTGRTTLSFVGKSGVRVTVSTRDSDIYRLIESRLAGKSGTDSLFQTTDAQLLEYLAETIGPGFLTKDFRTLKANVMALEMVSRMRRPTTMTAYRKARNKVADAVAKQLGNTRATTLKSYINPTVFGPWEDVLQ